jgi:hypothetical protein
MSERNQRRCGGKANKIATSSHDSSSRVDGHQLKLAD